METHVRVAGWLRILWSAGALVLALLALLLFTGFGAAMGMSGDWQARAAASWIVTVGVFVSMFFGLLALPGLLIGWGLLTFRPWARVLDMALSAFDLFHVPLGTALGAYSIWVMLQPETVALFEAGVPPRRYPVHF